MSENLTLHFIKSINFILVFSISSLNNFNCITFDLNDIFTTISIDRNIAVTLFTQQYYLLFYHQAIKYFYNSIIQNDYSKKVSALPPTPQKTHIHKVRAL